MLVLKSSSTFMLLLLCGWLPFVAIAASADPMRIGNATPRKVVVQFENSSTDHPELLDRTYGIPLPAWLESNAEGNIVVRIDGAVLERSVFETRNPVAGSFSDYVWVFDAVTGDVLSASFSGKLKHRLNFGLAKADIEARVEAHMTTTEAGGFTPARRVWGRSLTGFCSDAGVEDCRLVEPARYDADRGYVNAVGFLQINSSFVELATYSALGEARFSESPTRDEKRGPTLGLPQWVAASEANVAATLPLDFAAQFAVGSPGRSLVEAVPVAGVPPVGPGAPDVSAPPPGVN